MPKKFRLEAAFGPSGDQPQAIASLIHGLTEGVLFQTLLGVTGSGKTFTVANVIEKLQRPALILAPNKTLAAQLYGEMKAFFPKNAVEYFVSYYDYYQPEAYVPASDTYIEKDSSINEHIEQMRLSATKAILSRRDVIIVATVSAIYGLGDPDSYLSMMLHLSCGDEVRQTNILRRLAELQYTRNDVELHRGNYRVRGDVIDVFPAESEKYAVRIALFGNEVEALSLFDPLTGHVIEKLPRATIFPKTHCVTPRQQIIDAVEAIKSELKNRLEELRENNKLVEELRLSERTRYDIEMLLELGYCQGIENYSRHLTKREKGQPPPTLIDYLPKDAIIFIDESHVTVPQLGAMYRGDRSRKETLVEYGFRLPSAMDNRPLQFDEFLEIVRQTVFVSATPGNFEVEKSGGYIEQLVRPTGLLDPEIMIRKQSTQVDDVLSEIHKTVEKNERVLITTLTKRMAEDLCDYLAGHGVKVRYLHSDIDTVERVEIIRDLRLGVFDVLIGINLLREGLDMPEVSLVAIFDADKEGFLRSTRSLIQTIGRAARNVHGRVILYADKITQSMQMAINETDRRRQKQKEYNVKNQIIPQTIQKNISDILEGAHVRKVTSKKTKKNLKAEYTFPLLDEIRECTQKHDQLSSQEIGRLLKKWDQAMFELARNLEFEKAALVRDELQIFSNITLKNTN